MGKVGLSLNKLVQKGESNEERKKIKKKRGKSNQNIKNMNMVKGERLVSRSLNQ